MNFLPPILPPRFQTIPSELKDRDQWVVWKGVWQPEKGKYNKVPFNARTLNPASSTDPSTWSSFDHAQKAFECYGERFDGIGFVLCKADPLCGVDLDHVIDADQSISESAKEIIAALGTYAEVSPSGTGVRLFALAKLPPGGRKKGDIEAYESGRFLTVTGRRLPTAPATINERQAEIETFHAGVFPVAEKRTSAPNQTPFDVSDTDLLSVAFRAENGGKVAALYAGSTGGYAGESEADYALCCLLAFYTGDDPARLERLVRGSNLRRDKWDEDRNGESWITGRVKKAIASCTEFWKPKGEAKPITSEDVPDIGRRPKVKENPGPSEDSRNAPPAAAFQIPDPALRTEKNEAEYAPYQIAELLGLDAEAPDTQRALASRATRVYRDVLGHVRELGYVRFDGKRWRTDDKQESATATMFCKLSDTVREEAAALFRYVSDLIKANRLEHSTAMMKAARRHLGHVKVVESEKFAAGAMILARSALDIPRGRFDIKPFVIGFENGVWDNGTWREHRREDYLLDLSPVTVDLEADRSEWLAVLDRITGGDTDLQRSIQDMAGYALSGSSTLRFVPWLYGPKGSGKSTIAELLKTALGTMAAVIDSSLLSPDAERGRLGAAIYGKRLAVIAEAGGQRIDGEALKTLSGGDTLPVRMLYKEPFDVLPRHMVLLVANDPPTMTAYDEALRDRVSALPCKHSLQQGEALTFTEGKRIEDVRQMPDSLLVRGFTAWAIEGLARVQVNRDIYRAPIVETETRQFWEDADPLTEFWGTQDEAELLAGIGRGELRQRYQTWAAQNCIRKPLSLKVWAEACRAHGLYEAWKDRTIKIWKLFKLSANAANEKDPNSDKSRGKKESPYKDFTENTSNRVGGVGGPFENGTDGTPKDPNSDKSRGKKESPYKDFTENTSNQGSKGSNSEGVPPETKQGSDTNTGNFAPFAPEGENDAFYDDPFSDPGDCIDDEGEVIEV